MTNWEKEFDEKFMCDGELLVPEGFDDALDIKSFIQSLLDKKAEEVSNEFISACNCNFCNGSGLDEAVTVYFDFDGEKCMDRKLIECSFCHGTGSRINHEHYDQLKQKYIKGESNGKDS